MNWNASATDWMKSSWRIVVMVAFFRAKKILASGDRRFVEAELAQDRRVVLSDFRNRVETIIELVVHRRGLERRQLARGRLHARPAVARGKLRVAPDVVHGVHVGVGDLRRVEARAHLRAGEPREAFE